MEKTDSASCRCGALAQTIRHLVFFCQNYCFVGDMKELNEAKSNQTLSYLNKISL